MGLFGIFKKSPPQEWVDLIFTDSTTASKVPLRALQEATQQRVENSNRIMQDCIRIMKDTKNPDTFFTRYNLFDEHLYFLTRIEPYCKFKGRTPSQLWSEAVSAREETVELFLRVRFNELWDFVHGNGTSRTKGNRIKKFTEMLNTYKPQIPNSVFLHYSRKAEN